jgi:CRISPR-associated protein Cmr1
MESQMYHLKFIMPCFCAGADQGTAELRPSSIRGALRWWFRVLGGSKEEEREVFGGIAKESKSARSSSFIIRAEILKLGESWKLPKVDSKGTSSYVWHFVQVSGVDSSQEGTKKKGPRWNENAFLPPKTEWILHIVQRRNLAENLQKKFQEALQCFLMLGSVGLRVTRGLGAFSCLEKPFDDSQLGLMFSNANIRCEL